MLSPVELRGHDAPAELIQISEPAHTSDQQTHTAGCAMIAFVGACLAGWPDHPRRAVDQSGTRLPAPTPTPDERTAMHLKAANDNTPRALGRMIALLTAITVTSSALLAALAG
jgi:hypothetical protein